MFLRVLHGLSAHLLSVIVVQHLMGLGAALLFFLAVRRCGGPRGLGLAPAAIICLGGDQLFLEHAALSDALFIFLISATLYCAVRASQDGARWAALAGVCAGLGVWDREAGLAMVVVIALWLAFSAGRPTRRTLTAGALSLALAVASIGIYVGWREAESGLSGLTTNSAWNLYGRVAPWADCNKFTPPAGTRALCEQRPVAERRNPLFKSKPPLTSEYYIYAPKSPAYQLLGPAFAVSKVPHAMALLQKFSKAAILGEPLEYLHAVWLDTLRLFDPNRRSYGDYSANEMIAFMLGGFPANSGRNEFVEYWQQRVYPHDPRPHRGDIGPLKRWERLTRVEGVWMGILLALCLAGPWLLAGRARAGSILFALTALTLLFFPILVKSYDYRFVIPAFAPLFAGGALGGWGLLVAIRERTRLRRPRGAAPSRGAATPVDPSTRWRSPDA
jgi:hypothetical protein